MAMPYVQDGVFRVYIRGNAPQPWWHRVLWLDVLLAGLRDWENPRPVPHLHTTAQRGG